MDTSKSPKQKITIQLPQALLDAMKAQAEAHRRSLTGEIEWALLAYVSRQQRAGQAEHEQQ